MQEARPIDSLQTMRRFEMIMGYFKQENLRETNREHYTEIMNLPFRQLEALRILSYMVQENDLPGLSLKQLAKLIGASEPSTSLIVDQLVRKGLFERKENPNDRRSLYICLTERGSEQLELLSDNLRSKLDQLFHLLSKQDQLDFQRIATTLHDHFIKHIEKP